MSRRSLIILLLALLLVVPLALNFTLPPGFWGPHVYLSGQKAYVRVDDSGLAVETTLCFWTTDMKSAALAARPIVNSNGNGFITGPGFISLESDGKFHNELKFNKANKYGILAVPLTTDIVKETPGGKYPVCTPKAGSAYLYVSDALNSGAKKYDIQIVSVYGDSIIFTAPKGLKLKPCDAGSPIIQNNAFVGAAQVSMYDTDEACKGLSAPVMYKELVKAESGN